LNLFFELELLLANFTAFVVTKQASINSDVKTTTITARNFQLRKARHFLVKNHLHQADKRLLKIRLLFIAMVNLFYNAKVYRDD